MTDWALSHVTVAKDATILDVGCGGGRTIQQLAIMAPQGKVYGVDISAASVAASQATNAAETATGRVNVQQASVAALPFPDRQFDLVTASETHYYWPDLPANVREVLRVIKPGGTICLIAETHRNGVLGHLYRIPMALIRATHLSDAEFRELLITAGFADVQTLHRPGRNWICAVGRKPA
jgi:ubiquinone/menaquinone biosynthesis C-methylase UbiE